MRCHPVIVPNELSGDAVSESDGERRPRAAGRRFRVVVGDDGDVVAAARGPREGRRVSSPRRRSDHLGRICCRLHVRPRELARPPPAARAMERPRRRARASARGFRESRALAADASRDSLRHSMRRALDGMRGDVASEGGRARARARGPNACDAERFELSQIRASCCSASDDSPSWVSFAILARYFFEPPIVTETHTKSARENASTRRPLASLTWAPQMGESAILINLIRGGRRLSSSAEASTSRAALTTTRETSPRGSRDGTRRRADRRERARRTRAASRGLRTASDGRASRRGE